MRTTVPKIPGALFVCAIVGLSAYALASCYDFDNTSTACKGTNGMKCVPGTYPPTGMECWVCTETEYSGANYCECASGTAYTRCGHMTGGRCYKTRTVYMDGEGNIIERTEWNDTPTQFCFGQL